MMKRSSANFLIKLVCLCLICMTLFTSCGKKVRVVKFLTAGSSAFAYTNTGETYKIKELNLESQNGVFHFEDYYVSEDGQQYNVTNKKGKVVSKINLAKKSETYNPQVYEFNIDTLELPGINITTDMNYVVIYSDDNSKSHDITVIIDPHRTTPCDIEFKNVNIQTSDYVSPVSNFSDQAVNIKMTGENYFKAGSFNNFEEYYASIQNSQDLFDKTSGNITALAFYGYYFEVRAINVYFMSLTGKGDFVEEYKSVVRDSVTLIDTFLSSADNLLNNQAGQDGYDGAAAISSLGPVYIYGSGNATLIGGNGTNGLDADTGVLGHNSVKGGDGGNGGCAILGEIVVENMSGSISMAAGSHGFGGNGAGNNPKKGADGKSTETIICECSSQKSN